MFWMWIFVTLCSIGTDSQFNRNTVWRKRPTGTGTTRRRASGWRSLVSWNPRDIWALAHHRTTWMAHRRWISIPLKPRWHRCNIDALESMSCNVNFVFWKQPDSIELLDSDLQPNFVKSSGNIKPKTQYEYHCDILVITRYFSSARFGWIFWQAVWRWLVDGLFFILSPRSRHSSTSLSKILNYIWPISQWLTVRETWCP